MDVGVLNYLEILAFQLSENLLSAPIINSSVTLVGFLSWTLILHKLDNFICYLICSALVLYKAELVDSRELELTLSKAELVDSGE